MTDGHWIIHMAEEWILGGQEDYTLSIDLKSLLDAASELERYLLARLPNTSLCLKRENLRIYGISSRYAKLLMPFPLNAISMP